MSLIAHRGVEGVGKSTWDQNLGQARCWISVRWRFAMIVGFRRLEERERG